jgi:hypothetical protein
MAFSSISQFSGAIAGGLAGGLAGFVAYLIRLRMERLIQRKNVSAALAAEIEALCDHLTQHYVKRLEYMLSPNPRPEPYPYHGFRGEREYMPVFRVLGQNLGVLPRPLPRELIFWYTTLTICLERGRDLYEIAKSQSPESSEYAIAMAEMQREEIGRLLATSATLIETLEQLAGTRSA